ncbi:transposable element Tcb1 transposase [Trichonephila clavipes]|nr:transposable element Tcb1 transposase [Trichonephila clavipes]
MAVLPCPKPILSSCAAEKFSSDVSLEAVNRRAPNNLKNWQWTMEDDDSLTANHRRLRLQWAHEHRDWQADWHQVVFLDESRFNLWDHDSRIRVRRFAGERCFPECVIERHSGLTPGVRVWGAISYQGRSNLLRIESTLNSNRTATPAELVSLFQAPKDWYQGKPRVEGFATIILMRGDQPFAFCSCHAIDGNVCIGHVNMSTDHVISGGLFFLWVGPGLAPKAIVGIFSFGENLELICLKYTFVKEMHTDQAVPMFKVVYLWTYLQTSNVNTLIEKKSWTLMCAFLLGQ